MGIVRRCKSGHDCESLYIRPWQLFIRHRNCIYDTEVVDTTQKLQIRHKSCRYDTAVIDTREPYHAAHDGEPHGVMMGHRLLRTAGHVSGRDFQLKRTTGHTKRNAGTNQQREVTVGLIANCMACAKVHNIKTKFMARAQLHNRDTKLHKELTEIIK